MAAGSATPPLSPRQLNVFQRPINRKEREKISNIGTDFKVNWNAVDMWPPGTLQLAGFFFLFEFFEIKMLTDEFNGPINCVDSRSDPVAPPGTFSMRPPGTFQLAGFFF